MSTFIELRFHARGKSAHRAAVEQIRQISGVEVLLDHTRELGWLERQSLRIDEWDCRIVVAVEATAEVVEKQRHVTAEADPYRSLVFGEPVKQVPARLADLIDELEADYALVEAGWLRFETRTYERALLEQLETDLVTLAGNYVTARLVHERGGLRGRLEGHIPVIRTLQRHLLRSGLVDHERILVGYE